MTEEEGHVTRDRGTRGASQEVFPGPISAELTSRELGNRKGARTFSLLVDGLVKSNGFEMFEFLRKMSR